MDKYTSKQVAKFFDIPLSTLNFWISKGYIHGIEPHAEEAKRGRLFNLRDICTIGVFRYITEYMGVNHKFVRGRFGFGVYDIFSKGIEAHGGESPHWWGVEIRAGKAWTVAFTPEPEAEAEKFSMNGNGAVTHISKIDTSAIIIDIINRLGTKL